MVQLPIERRENCQDNLQTIKEYNRIGGRYLAALKGTEKSGRETNQHNGSTPTLSLYSTMRIVAAAVYGISVNCGKKKLFVSAFSRFDSYRLGCGRDGIVRAGRTITTKKNSSRHVLGSMVSSSDVDGCRSTQENCFTYPEL
jgi:hypothetical protein